MKRALLVLAISLLAGCVVGLPDAEIDVLFSQCSIPENMQTMPCTDEETSACEAMGYGSACVVIVDTSSGAPMTIPECCGEPRP